MRSAANKCECGADAEDISFDRRICACGSLHYYCNQCGTRAEPCADERPDAHCEQNAITETSQRGLGYQSGEPAGAVNSGSAPANAAYRYPEIERGQVWRSLDPRDVARERTVEIEKIDRDFAYVISFLGNRQGRRSRIHRSRFDGVQFEKVTPRDVCADSILSSDELRQMFMQREYTSKDVERLLISHAALINKVKWLESKP